MSKKEPQTAMRGFSFFQQKAYFDKGMDILNYGKYIIAALGIATDNIKTILILAGSFAVAAYIVGLIWFKLKFIDAELEVYNRVNPFVRDMRQLSASSVHRKT